MDCVLFTSLAIFSWTEVTRARDILVQFEIPAKRRLEHPGQYSPNNTTMKRVIRAVIGNFQTGTWFPSYEPTELSS